MVRLGNSSVSSPILETTIPGKGWLRPLVTSQSNRGQDEVKGNGK